MTLKRPRCFSGIWLAVLAAAVVLGWRLWVVFDESHLLTVATEIGSIGLSKEGQSNEELIPNQDGTRVIFYQETETGVGTYFCEPASGKVKLLFEQKEKGYSLQCGLLGWSPDDRYFAVGVPANVDAFDYVKSILVYDSLSATPAATLSADGFSWDSKFLWLSPHSFARTTHNQAWLVYDQMSDGNWQQTQVIKRFCEGKMDGLAAIAPRLLAWQQGNEFWTYDLDSGASVKVWQSDTNELKSFEHAESAGKVILHCRDANGLLAVTLRLPRPGETSGAILQTSRENAEPNPVELSLDQGRYDFTIKSSPQADPVHFAWDGMVEYYKLAGNRLFFAGNPDGEPPGIWQYDLPSKTATRIATGLKRKLIHTTFSRPEGYMNTNIDGKSLNYHVWRPIKTSNGQKYPLIIGQTHYMWFLYPQIAANEGYYFATADRVTWWAGLNNWEGEVLRLYEILRTNPEIDTNRVFLIATSAESYYVSDLVEERPKFCRGVILLNPGSLPRLAGTHLSAMFIVAGKDEAAGRARSLTKYQEDAAKTGIPVRLILQDGVQHITRSIATERERARQFARFLHEN